VPERCRRLDALDHDQIIELPLESRGRKIRGAHAHHAAVNLIAFEAYARAGFVLAADLDAL